MAQMPQIRAVLAEIGRWRLILGLSGLLHSARNLLSGVKRTPSGPVAMSVFNPKQTLLASSSTTFPETETAYLVRVSGFLRRPFRTKRPCSVRPCSIQGSCSVERPS